MSCLKKKLSVITVFVSIFNMYIMFSACLYLHSVQADPPIRDTELEDLQLAKKGIMFQGGLGSRNKSHQIIQCLERRTTARVWE